MKVFVGYDRREDAAYRVCEYSIKKHEPRAEIIPLKLSELKMFNRPYDPLSSTEFTFTRFLVPYLMGYQGQALFVDCDFVFTQSVSQLFCPTHPVMVVKHIYTPVEAVKMDQQVQHQYHRKNWSSLMMFDCQHPSNAVLTPELINTVPGLFLHQFQWLQDTEIGALDPAWNHLVGWSENPNPKGIHYTQGGPWFEQYKNCDYSDIWHQYKLELESQYR